MMRLRDFPAFALVAAAVFVAIVLLFGCGPTTEPNAPKPVSGDACEQAGARLSHLGCKEAKSPKGTLFVTVCKDAAQNGVDLKASCIAETESCAGVGLCR